MEEPEEKSETVLPKQGSGDVVDVTMHPLVLLSAADHYHRVARGTRKRVVGVLLGTVSRGSVDVTNSFAVPFEEDSKNPAVFYLDHNFLENMLAMFRKVNARERVVGFYSTGPQIRPNDLRIYDIVQRFLPAKAITPLVFCIIDIRPDRPSMPTTSYKVVEEVDNNQNNNKVRLTFAHVPSKMGAMETEEIGVEHLLRDINDPTISTMATLIRGKLAGLRTLEEKLRECQDYLQTSLEQNTQVHPDISANLQTILNLLPNLNQEDLVRAMLTKTNDLHMAIYLSALIRSVLALHDLVNNKIQYGEQEQPDKKETALVVEEKKEDEAAKKTKAAESKS